MISVTDKAKEKLLEALREQQAEPGSVLRVVLAPSIHYPLGFVVDEQEEGDHTVDLMEGVTLLILGPAVAAALQGTVIDYQESPQGEEYFTVSRNMPIN
jgi:Fe-S cluster assembly iron-binding protein IscA